MNKNLGSTVAVLGPQGTFSEIAAKKFLEEAGIKGKFIYCSEIDEIFEEVSNDTDFGVIPLENSIEGSINLTMDCLRRYENVKIKKEIVIDISLSLCAKKDIENVKVICSHPVAIAQCRKFLKELNKKYKFEIYPVKSTASACEMAKNDASVAAIASKETGKFYGLNLIFEDINDYKSQTRFIVISKSDKIFNGKKIGMIFEVKDRPGALYDVLKEFAERNINLTKIESRPSKRMLGEYFFFMEFEGNLDDKRIKEAINNVKKKVKFAEILGNY